MPGVVVELEPGKADELAALIYAAYNCIEDAGRMLDRAAGVMMDGSRKEAADDDR